MRFDIDIRVIPTDQTGNNMVWDDKVARERAYVFVGGDKPDR